MEGLLIIVLVAVALGMAGAMVLRAQRRGRPQPLDGLTDDVYQGIPAPRVGMRGFREQQPK